MGVSENLLKLKWVEEAEIISLVESEIISYLPGKGFMSFSQLKLLICVETQRS